MDAKNGNCYIIDIILKDICEFLQIPNNKSKILRINTDTTKHGDLSIPLSKKHWHNTIDNIEKYSSILFYLESKNPSFQVSEDDMTEKNLINESLTWNFPLEDVSIYEDNINFYFRRNHLFKEAIRNCLDMKEKYGALQNFPNVSFIVQDINDCSNKEMSLLLLRMKTLKAVCENLTNFKMENSCDASLLLCLTTKRNQSSDIVVGPVINENGKKDFLTTAEEFIEKRSVDMRLMAEHKYGLRMRLNHWKEYYRKLGEAAVMIEFIQTKPHKNVKVSLNYLNDSGRGKAFILYNCARLSALLDTFEKKVEQGELPPLVPLEEIDIDDIDVEREEWTLLYGYILQYPNLIRSCVKDVEKSIVNPHYLVSFLSGMCAVFSKFYKTTKILDTRYNTRYVHYQIYFLKAIEQVFNNTLRLLNIDPIRRM